MLLGKIESEDWARTSPLSQHKHPAHVKRARLIYSSIIMHTLLENVPSIDTLAEASYTDLFLEVTYSCLSLYTLNKAKLRQFRWAHLLRAVYFLCTSSFARAGLLTLERKLLLLN